MSGFSRQGSQHPTVNSTAANHVLLYEPRTEGHHLGWLRFIVDDLLSAGFQLSIAADLRDNSKERVFRQLDGVEGNIKLFSAYDKQNQRHLDGKTRSVAHCLKISGAQRVFLCALDEIASDCWRKATFGQRPPKELRGRIGGIYHRPRFLAHSSTPMDRWLKITGFRRLLKENWFQQILFLDEFLARDLQLRYPSAPLFFLPDPCPPGYRLNAIEARKTLSLPEHSRIFLFYGTGARRKGLHLVVEAMLQLPDETPAFLLCAGQQDPSGHTADGLQKLVAQNRARFINRYVSEEEEKLCFAASDAVLLPYLNHFGTSGVLSRAMSAGKPVITSDEQLLGKLTREHELGFLFPSGQSAELCKVLEKITLRFTEENLRFTASTQRYAAKYSRSAFREALLQCVAP